jgi:hypothetical protein
LDQKGGFLGVEMGREALPPSLRGAIERFAMMIAGRYHTLGYRGFCDVDFVVGKNRGIYVVETNPRRTGGTHVYDLARHLFGATWESDAYFLSNDMLCYGARVMDAGSILDRIRPLLFPVQGERRGVIVTSVNVRDPVLGYVIVAPDPAEGRAMQEQLFEVLGAPV